MKKKYIKMVVALSIGILIIFGSSSYASTRITGRLTENYKRWQGLSIGEKQTAIQPSLFSVSMTDFTDKTVYNRFKIGAGETLASSYVLSNDIDFSIRDQQKTDECWAFSTASVLETNVAKTKNKSMIFSPRHMDYATSRTFLDGINPRGFSREIGMGNFFLSFSYLTNGQGAVLEKDMPFENNENKINLAEIDKDIAMKADDYVCFPDIYKTYSNNGNAIYSNGAGTTYTYNQVKNVRDIMKEHIKKYGAVTAYTYIGSDIGNYISTSSGVTSYYNNNPNKIYNHGVTIVGWNDNYPISAFRSDRRPTKPGAYLVLNSSSAGLDQLRLIAVSYEDVWIDVANFGVISSSEIDYDNLYQHDEYGYDVPITMVDDNTGRPVSSGYIANVYNRVNKQGKDEFLNKVSVYLVEDSRVEIYVNAQNDNKSTLTKVATTGELAAGYHTINLDTPIKLTGSKFVIAAKLYSNTIDVGLELNPLSNGMGRGTFWDYVTSNRGESYTSTDGRNWIDLADEFKDANVCLKGFTTYEDAKEDEIKIGDLNKDGKVTLLDLSLMNQILVGKITPNDYMKKAGDINKDGNVTLLDLSMLNQILVGKIQI